MDGETEVLLQGSSHAAAVKTERSNVEATMQVGATSVEEAVAVHSFS